MQQTQLARAVRLDARTLRRLLKLVSVQLANLPRPTVPLALSVPHLPSIPHLPLESLSLLPSALHTSLQTHLTSVSAETITLSLRSISGASLNLNLDTTALQALLTRLLATVHTRLPAALARSVPSDPDLFRAAVHKLAITQARSHAVRYGIQVALGFALRLLPEVGRSLPVPLRLALSLARLAVRQAIGQAVRVIVGMAVRQAVATRPGVSLGKGPWSLDASNAVLRFRVVIASHQTLRHAGILRNDRVYPVSTTLLTVGGDAVVYGVLYVYLWHRPSANTSTTSSRCQLAGPMTAVFHVPYSDGMDHHPLVDGM